MEEKRRWELRQAEWTRQDKKAELQKEIEDVREAAQQQREILERRIEDVRDAAEKQREVWEETYQRMQEDFSDHNINLLATAAAYDPAFWEDAKTKGELWVQGFKDGTAGFEDYLASLTSGAKSTISGGGGSGSGGGGSVTTIKGKLTDHQKAVINSPGFQSMSDSAKQSWYKSQGLPTSHTGSMVVGEGVASLIPGEIIFPPDLSVQLERLIGVLSTRPLPPTQQQPTQAQQQWRGGGVEVRGNLLNIENANFKDDTDIEIMSRELRRQVGMLTRR
jgi:hypothetical protein